MVGKNLFYAWQEFLSSIQWVSPARSHCYRLTINPLFKLEAAERILLEVSLTKDWDSLLRELGVESPMILGGSDGVAANIELPIGWHHTYDLGDASMPTRQPRQGHYTRVLLRRAFS